LSLSNSYCCKDKLHIKNFPKPLSAAPSPWQSTGRG
jgi:hypothetical protein